VPSRVGDRGSPLSREWLAVTGQASEGVAVDRVCVPFADNEDLDQFGADMAVDQPEAFGTVAWQVELDSEEAPEVPVTLRSPSALPRRRPNSTSVAAARAAPATPAPCSAASCTTSARAGSVQLSR